jgi:hypothetical protein
MRAPEYIGYWICQGCHARVWATATLEDALSYPPCPSCMIGKMQVDRRRGRQPVRRERRARPEPAAS